MSSSSRRKESFSSFDHLHDYELDGKLLISPKRGGKGSSTYARSATSAGKVSFLNNLLKAAGMIYEVKSVDTQRACSRVGGDSKQSLQRWEKRNVSLFFSFPNESVFILRKKPLYMGSLQPDCTQEILDERLNMLPWDTLQS